MKDCEDDSTCGDGICLPNPFQDRPKGTNGWYGDIVERNANKTPFDESTYVMRWDHTHCVNVDKTDDKRESATGRHEKWANTIVSGAGRAEADNTHIGGNVYRCCF